LSAVVSALKKERFFTASSAEVQVKPAYESSLTTSILKAVKRNSTTLI
jgi:hypothetical protein